MNLSTFFPSDILVSVNVQSLVYYFIFNLHLICQCYCRYTGFYSLNSLQSGHGCGATGYGAISFGKSGSYSLKANYDSYIK